MRMREKTLLNIYPLEMLSRDELRPSAGAVSGFEMRRAAYPSPTFSRMLYAGVGGGWNWYERLAWSDEQWLAYLDRPELEMWVGYRHGTPAGYCELERQEQGNVEIVYFGLLPEFIGQGLGGVLLTTCTLDHPYALRNYLARGFRVFKEVQDWVALPPSQADGFEARRAPLPFTPSLVPKE